MGGGKGRGVRDVRGRGGVPEMSGQREEMTMDETSMDFTMEELREFLEADNLDVPVDPAFKERLRRTLWDMLRRRARPKPDARS